MNLPGVRVSAPPLRGKDREDLRFAVREGVDLVALSFVRGPGDVQGLRSLLEEFGADIPVVATGRMSLMSIRKIGEPPP